MFFLLSLWLACILDLLIGDPLWSYHPVRLIGALCEIGERWGRRLIANEKIAGIVTSIFVLATTAVTGGLFFWCLGLISPLAVLAGSAVVLYTTIAAQDLIKHSNAVYQALVDPELSEQDSLTLARKRVAMIVGRDTAKLKRGGIVRACVESVSESMSDGIVAPLFWAVIGALAAGDSQWAPAFAAGSAMVYKAANTMDSMFGYKNQHYRYFGWFAARFDDLLNLIPARLAALALVGASFFMGLGAGAAWKIMLRDSRVHSSPNAGYPEAAMAGALGLKLGGPSYYFGRLVEKATLGENVNQISAAHIRQANTLVLLGSLISLLILSYCYFSIFYISW